jgi:hypothetical protein
MSTIDDIRGLKFKTTGGGGEINVSNYLATSTFRAPDVRRRVSVVYFVHVDQITYHPVSELLML